MRKFFWMAAFVLLAAGSAKAEMVLTYDVGSNGVATLNGSTLPDTVFTVQAHFDETSPTVLTTGIAGYSVSSVTAQVGALDFDADLTGDLFVELVDATNSEAPGAYIPALGRVSTGGGFVPFYTGTTTPGWSALAPTPTGFTGYTDISSLLQRTLVLTSGSDELDLVFDGPTGVTSTLTEMAAAPMPSALSMSGVWGVVCLAGMLVMRRQAKLKMAVV